MKQFSMRMPNSTAFLFANPRYFEQWPVSPVIAPRVVLTPNTA
jgi:hypothetical protein